MKPDPKCKYHPDASTIILPSGNIHNPKLCCAECKIWLKWLPKDDDRLKNLVFLKPKQEVKQLLIFE